MTHKATLATAVLLALATCTALAQQPVQQPKEKFQPPQKTAPAPQKQAPAQQPANNGGGSHGIDKNQNKHCQHHEECQRANNAQRPNDRRAEMVGKFNRPDAQRRTKGPELNADGIDMAIVRAFPTVKKLNKERLVEVLDADGKRLGYALYSKPASDGIKGFNGETPLLIALSPKKKIISVELLANNEGPRYVKSIEQAGLLKAWNGLNIKKARKKKVDTVSGATYTSKAIIETMQKALSDL
ncbi:MAG: FMN-binding protein [Bacteroidales bacterium]|nr:FMN-binding protein [Bacteroidales bacterium]